MPRFQGVWLIHRTLGDGVRTHYVPDDPGVIRSEEARGWEVTKLPTELDSDDPEFIDALEKLLAEDQPKKSAKKAKSAEAESATDKEGNE